MPPRSPTAAAYSSVGAGLPPSSCECVPRQRAAPGFVCMQSSGRRAAERRSACACRTSARPASRPPPIPSSLRSPATPTLTRTPHARRRLAWRFRGHGATAYRYTAASRTQQRPASLGDALDTTRIRTGRAERRGGSVYRSVTPPDKPPDIAARRSHRRGGPEPRRGPGARVAGSAATTWADAAAARRRSVCPRSATRSGRSLVGKRVSVTSRPGVLA